MRNSQGNNSLLENNDALVAGAPTAVEGVINPNTSLVQNFTVVYLPKSHRLVLYINAHAKGHHSLQRLAEKRYPDEIVEIQGGGGAEFNPETKELIVYSASTTLGTVEPEIIRLFLEELKEAFHAEKLSWRSLPLASKPRQRRGLH